MNIKILDRADFVETSYRGSVMYEGKEYEFWFTHIEDHMLTDYSTDGYEVEWFLKKIPMKVRKMENNIIEEFKKKINEKSTLS